MTVHFARELLGTYLTTDTYDSLAFFAASRKREKEAALTAPSTTAEAMANWAWERFCELARSLGLTPVCTGLKPHVTIGDPGGRAYYFPG